MNIQELIKQKEKTEEKLSQLNKQINDKRKRSEFRTSKIMTGAIKRISNEDDLALIIKIISKYITSPSERKFLGLKEDKGE